MGQQATWVQVGITVVSMVLGAAFVNGRTAEQSTVQASEVSALRSQVQSDHDKVTGMDQKLDDLKSDVGEIKQDIKSLIHGK